MDKRAKTRQLLLEAAAVEFAERGYQHATTKQICHRAQANAAAVCYHFTDKLGIYLAVLTIAAEEVSKIWAKDLALGQTVDERLRLAIRQMMSYCSNVTDVSLRIVMNEIAAPSDARAVVADLLRSRVELLAKLVSSLSGTSVQSARTKRVVYSIMSQITFFYTAAPAIELLWPGTISKQARTGQLSAYVEEFCVAALSPRRSS